MEKARETREFDEDDYEILRFCTLLSFERDFPALTLTSGRSFVLSRTFPSSLINRGLWCHRSHTTFTFPLHFSLSFPLTFTLTSIVSARFPLPPSFTSSNFLFIVTSPSFHSDNFVTSPLLRHSYNNQLFRLEFFSPILSSPSSRHFHLNPFRVFCLHLSLTLKIIFSILENYILVRLNPQICLGAKKKAFSKQFDLIFVPILFLSKFRFIKKHIFRNIMYVYVSLY